VVVLLDNSIGAEIYRDGIVGLDLSIQDCACGKKNHTYAEVVYLMLHQLH